MISMSGLTPAKLIRAICVYLAYEHTDIARVLLRDASGGIKLPTELYELAAAQISALERRASLRTLVERRVAVWRKIVEQGLHLPLVGCVLFQDVFFHGG